MDIDIGAFDPEKRSVPVTFTEGDVVHSRDVNACLDEAGDYDPQATSERVQEVAAGVAVKIALGVIRKAKPADEASPEA
jgi:hypothetical protein